MPDINNTQVQTLRDISKAVKEYAEGVKADIDKLVSRHDLISNEWSGEQYDRLSEILREAQKKLTRQSEVLKEISADVMKDAERLEIAMRSKIDF